MTRGPTDDRKSIGSAAAWIVGLILSATGAYMGAYFTLPLGVEREPGLRSCRYASNTVAAVFVPAAWIEAKLAGRIVMVRGDEDPEFEYLAEP